MIKPVIPPGIVLSSPKRLAIAGGFTQSPFRPLLAGGLALVSDGAPSPPTVEPVLTVGAEFASFIANLTWTASNKAGSPGFGYEVYVSFDGGGFILETTTTNLFYSYDAGSTPGLYAFSITPKNDAGEGPNSNVADITLPGEFEAPVLTGPETTYLGTPYDLEWTAVTGAEGYNVYRSDDGVTYSPLGSTTNLLFEVTDTQQQFYYVKAYINGGTTEGPASNVFESTPITPVGDTYLRPDGVSTYFRPDGTSIYLRP